MLQKDWHAQVEGDKLVHITINDNVVLTDMDLVLLSDTRTSIVKTKVNTREIFLSGNTEKPMFVQIGHSVKYVKGSGGTFYKDVIV